MEAPTITTELDHAVTHYLAAKAYTETIRPDVEAYKTETLIACKVRWDTALLGRRERDERTEFITDMKYTFLGLDEDCNRLWVALDAAHKAHGFKVAEVGQCPLLVAEHNEIKAMWAVVTEAEYITDIPLDRATNNVERFHKLVDLIVGLVLSLEA